MGCSCAYCYFPTRNRALEQLGRGSLFKRYTNTYSHDEEKLIEAVSKAVQYMAKKTYWCFDRFEKETGLQDYIETGIAMNSEISQELLINVFIPNTPLHDGAMIVQNSKIASAASYLPLSDSAKISKSLELDIELQWVSLKFQMHLQLLFQRKQVQYL